MNVQEADTAAKRLLFHAPMMCPRCRAAKIEYQRDGGWAQAAPIQRPCRPGHQHWWYFDLRRNPAARIPEVLAALEREVIARHMQFIY